ncbi:MAG: UDP-N-acetylmuramate dehydrogenase [Flavobacteriales bacterium]
MIAVDNNISIKKYTTFGVPVLAKYFAQFANLQQLKELLLHSEMKSEKLLILGGGSNLLFTQNFDGLVLKNNIKGITVEKETREHIFVKSGAGENWHEFVLYCVNNNFAGVENLSLIPGNVGASPMQNIGAYGTEIKDVFHSLEAFEIETGKLITFDNEACKFGYRESIFKNSHKGKYIITSVTFKLTKKPIFNISYGAIESELEAMNIEKLSIEAISNAVINIRTRKLPNPSEIGNAGSFFKNPVISKAHFDALLQKYPAIAHYKLPANQFKIAAGWMIDQLGWKGKRIEDYGVHKNQALVLVNYGESSGKDIYDLSTEIIKSVEENFQISLEREVNII